MREKYLYFRTEATSSDDDATGDSACWPASSLMGMQPTADAALTLYFKPMVRRDPTGSTDATASLDNHDAVILTIPVNTHAIAMRAISDAINGDNFPAFLVIANDKSGATEYLAGSGVTACGAISVSAVYANS